MYTIRHIIIPFLIVFTIAFLYFGAYLPFRKAQLLIWTFQAIRTDRSLQAFERQFDNVLSYYSPIGGDETIQHYLQAVMAVLGGENNSPEVIRALVARSEAATRPILEKGAGFGYSQILYNIAMVYHLAAQKLQDIEFYNKALEMYRAGLIASPNRIFFLYGLFDLYSMGGELKKARSVGKYILKIYPQNDKIKTALDAIIGT